MKLISIHCSAGGEMWPGVWERANPSFFVRDLNSENWCVAREAGTETMQSSMYASAVFAPHKQWVGQEQLIPGLGEPGAGGTFVRKM